MTSFVTVAGAIAGKGQRWDWPFWVSAVVPAVPAMAAAVFAQVPDIWIGLGLISLVPKLALQARRSVLSSQTMRAVAAAADIAMLVTIVRLAAIPGTFGHGMGDVVSVSTALCAALAYGLRGGFGASAKPADNLRLAILNHELRTPLNAIIGFAGLLRTLPEAGLDPARCQNYARIMEASGEHMLAVLQATIGGRAEPQAHTSPGVELNRFLTETAELLLPLCASRAISLRLEPPAEILRAVANESALRQILINLLSNAIKFSPVGSTVTVGLCRRGANGAEISVSDQGMGMGIAELEAWGRPFARGGEAERREIEGSGLGLAISKGLAKHLGARLELFSEQGRGTTARLTLAAAAGTLKPAAPSRQSGTAVNRVFANAAS